MTQGKVFMLMSVLGVLIALLFDVFRSFRLSFKGAGKRFDFISTQITDVIFGLTAFFVFTLGVYIFNGGELRSYCFLGVIFGIFFYKLLPGRIIGLITRLIFKFLFKISVEIPKKLFTKSK